MKIPPWFAANSHFVVAALFGLLSNPSYSAVPEVAMETNPLTSLRCATHGIENMTVTGATASADSIADNAVSFYQAAFSKTTWSGSLKKYRFVVDRSTEEIKLSALADWDAADILTGSTSNAAKPTPEARHIFTSVKNNQITATVPFLWQDMSAAQRVLLNTSPFNGDDDQLGEKRLNYLRGERHDELGNVGGIFRKRDRILGAIVHGSPVFVGAPSTGPGGSDYPAFYETHKGRRTAVYVGAGDGMLHAFDAQSGDELFAYVPQVLLKNLGQLTKPNGAYVPFVDGVIAVAEARIGSQWKTILASGMGGGAQGVFALDVTTPDQFKSGLGALWEFTDADDADIGNVVGAPIIARFKSKTVQGVPSYRDFVVVAGGLNSYRDDGNGRFNLQAPGALFLLALDKPKSDPWKIGSNYFKFILPIADKAQANGLIAASMVLANDSTVSYLYAGDLQGNLWRFNFNGYAPWSNALGNSAKPLFIAMDGQRHRQPITQKVQVVYAPYGGHLILFGTGKWMETADMNSAHFKTQSFYGVLDTLDGQIVTRGELIERNLKQVNSGMGALEISGSEVKYAAPTNGDKGWYFDFLDAGRTGERSISSANIREDSLFFNTLIPNPDPCQKQLGRAYILKTLTGLPAYVNQSGQTISPVLITTPMVMAVVPEKIPARDATGKRREKKKLEVIEPIVSGLAGEKASGIKNTTEVSTVSGRLSWREIVNWVELRTPAIKKQEK